MKIALAQINTTLGNPKTNLKKHLEYIQRARSEGCDLIIFPELSLTGYLLQDLVPTVAARPTSDDPIFGPLLNASKDIDVIAGFVEQGTLHHYYIAAAYLSQGEVVHTHRKVYLPTYGMFDEGRFFARGDKIRAFDTRLGRFGMLVCEDFWHASPPYLLWVDGAEMLIFISASPGHAIGNSPQPETARWVEHINQAYATLFSCFVASTNRVGFEDGISFWGGATLHDPNGELVAKGPYYEEALSIAEVDLDQLQHVRTSLPLLRDERPELVQKELERILGNGRQGNR